MTALGDVLAARGPLPAGLLTQVANSFDTLPNPFAVAVLVASRTDVTAADLITMLRKRPYQPTADALATRAVTTDELWQIETLAYMSKRTIAGTLTGVLTDEHVATLLAADAPLRAAAFVARSPRRTWALAAVDRLLDGLTANPDEHRHLVTTTLVDIIAIKQQRPALTTRLLSITDRATLRSLATQVWSDVRLIQHVLENSGLRDDADKDRLVAHLERQLAAAAARPQASDPLDADQVLGEVDTDLESAIANLPADLNWAAFVTLLSSTNLDPGVAVAAAGDVLRPAT